ncbi:glycosyltransferase family 4 protein [Halomonas sp. KM-1]|uniref:glycosyltransferase family 4 protein n=1 Tax=Halomonas sp. KM-1 TaxID=590061 RepID=UPI000474E043|nr:glycosyltransferase family 4 protein [Halomonas sp. KM-1]
MKILLVHNHYGEEAPSGENLVYKLERQMLESAGHEVKVFERFSDEIRSRGRLGMLQGGLATPWNPFMQQRIKSIISEFNPNVMHVHNTFPLISPSIFSAASGTARVLTLHNYRLFCPAAIPMRQGNVCTACLDKKSVLPALRYGCYRSSRSATLPLATGVALHRLLGTWQRNVEAFIALTDFQSRCMVDAGLPSERVHVKPNFYPGVPMVMPWEKRIARAVFVGRISEEKGVADLIQAWLAWGKDAPELVIVGDGELRQVLQASVMDLGANHIRFVGQVSSRAAQQYIRESQLVIIPSRWFEGFPMVLREAIALGTPVLVSHLGPMPELVKEGGGLVFQAGNPQDLLKNIKSLWVDKSRLEKMSKISLRTFEFKYTEEVNYRSLMEIYQRAITMYDESLIARREQ